MKIHLLALGAIGKSSSSPLTPRISDANESVSTVSAGWILPTREINRDPHHPSRQDTPAFPAHDAAHPAMSSLGHSSGPCPGHGYAHAHYSPQPDYIGEHHPPSTSSFDVAVQSLRNWLNKHNLMNYRPDPIFTLQSHPHHQDHHHDEMPYEIIESTNPFERPSGSPPFFPPTTPTIEIHWRNLIFADDDSDHPLMPDVYWKKVAKLVEEAGDNRELGLLKSGEIVVRIKTPGKGVDTKVYTPGYNGDADTSSVFPNTGMMTIPEGGWRHQTQYPSRPPSRPQPVDPKSMVTTQISWRHAIFEGDDTDTPLSDLEIDRRLAAAINGLERGQRTLGMMKSGIARIVRLGTGFMDTQEFLPALPGLSEVAYMGDGRMVSEENVADPQPGAGFKAPVMKGGRVEIIPSNNVVGRDGDGPVKTTTYGEEYPHRQIPSHRPHPPPPPPKEILRITELNWRDVVFTDDNSSAPLTTKELRDKVSSLVLDEKNHAFIPTLKSGHIRAVLADETYEQVRHYFGTNLPDSIILPHPTSPHTFIETFGEITKEIDYKYAIWAKGTEFLSEDNKRTKISEMIRAVGANGGKLSDMLGGVVKVEMTGPGFKDTQIYSPGFGREGEQRGSAPGVRKIIRICGPGVNTGTCVTRHQHPGGEHPAVSYSTQLPPSTPTSLIERVGEYTIDIDWRYAVWADIDSGPSLSEEEMREKMLNIVAEVGLQGGSLHLLKEGVIKVVTSGPGLRETYIYPAGYGREEVKELHTIQETRDEHFRILIQKLKEDVESRTIEDIRQKEEWAHQNDRVHVLEGHGDERPGGGLHGKGGWHHRRPQSFIGR